MVSDPSGSRHGQLQGEGVEGSLAIRRLPPGISLRPGLLHLGVVFFEAPDLESLERSQLFWEDAKTREKLSYEFERNTTLEWFQKSACIC